MQRIDENTYIDDTLVTCAEYQLFIDEMREQGKYYQPDHWTSYHFPTGQAREPILGVRHSDAIAFCKWLAQQESNNWNYRLPFWNETEAFSMKASQENAQGYWDFQKHYFRWIGTNSENARMIKNELSRDIELARALEYFVEIRGPYHAYERQSLDLENTQKSWYVGQHGIGQLNPVLDRTFTMCPGSERIFVLENLFEQARTSAISHARPRHNLIFYGQESDFTIPMSIFVDLFTLQERIAGRSPAFEGIRLVKERIR